MSPFMCASECQMDWSSKAPDQKRSIPLVCELELLEWRFAKLEADEHYGEALQARARTRMGGARQQNVFLLTSKATASRHKYMAAFDSCGSCRFTLTHLLAHFSLFIYIYIYLFIYFFLFFSFFFSLSLFLSLFFYK